MGQGISKEGKKLFNAIKKDEIEAVQTVRGVRVTLTSCSYT